jgi:hypothetical protein
MVDDAIEAEQSITPYVRYGDWPVFLSLVIIFGTWLAGSTSAPRMAPRHTRTFSRRCDIWHRSPSGVEEKCFLAPWG